MPPGSADLALAGHTHGGQIYVPRADEIAARPQVRRLCLGPIPRQRYPHLHQPGARHPRHGGALPPPARGHDLHLPTRRGAITPVASVGGGAVARRERSPGRRAGRSAGAATAGRWLSRSRACRPTARRRRRRRGGRRSSRSRPARRRGGPRPRGRRSGGASSGRGRRCRRPRRAGRRARGRRGRRCATRPPTRCSRGARVGGPQRLSASSVGRESGKTTAQPSTARA